jgi:glycosyltransferase involved in cell wall biosynthesis
MPTWNRRRFVPLAIRCFLEQDYPDKELIIVADGEPIDDLIPPGAPNIRLLNLSGYRRSTIGSKFNLGIEEVHGDLLALWADDDWHAPQRLTVQADALLASDARMCGSDQVNFGYLENGEVWRYEYIPGRRTNFYLVGGTFFFRREFWQERPFEDSSFAEDNAFIHQRGEALCNVGNDWWYVAMVHGQNTCPKPLAARLGSDQWQLLDTPAASLVDSWWWKGATR